MRRPALPFHPPQGFHEKPAQPLSKFNATSIAKPTTTPHQHSLCQAQCILPPAQSYITSAANKQPSSPKFGAATRRCLHQVQLQSPFRRRFPATSPPH